MLKDYLSPDIWREYGPSQTEQQRGQTTACTSREDPQELPEQQKGEVTDGGGDNSTEEQARILQPPTETEPTKEDN